MSDINVLVMESFEMYNKWDKSYKEEALSGAPSHTNEGTALRMGGENFSEDGTPTTHSGETVGEFGTEDKHYSEGQPTAHSGKTVLQESSVDVSGPTDKILDKVTTKMTDKVLPKDNQDKTPMKKLQEAVIAAALTVIK